MTSQQAVSGNAGQGKGCPVPHCTGNARDDHAVTSSCCASDQLWYCDRIFLQFWAWHDESNICIVGLKLPQLTDNIGATDLPGLQIQLQASHFDG